MRLQAGERRGGDGFVPFVAGVRIAPFRQFEQIGALRGAELEGAREPRKRRRRHGDVAALLEPGVPGHAQSAELGGFLAPQPGRATPAARGQPERPGRELLPLRPDEIAEPPFALAGQGCDHGAKYTRIKKDLKPVSGGGYPSSRTDQRDWRKR